MALNFPNGFLWGAATSGYQIEGAPAADGKGPSIWDTFTHQPGRVLHGDTGDRACDTYHPRQLESDLDLMRDLGLKAYIFSVQWPRIQPTGRGPANVPGLDYYRRLLDGLVRRDIVPCLTIYHWELPQALQDAGGWLNRDTTDRFFDYVTILLAAFGSQVRRWITINEPHTVAWLGHGIGRHAPGLTGAGNALAVAHHLLLAHGKVAQALGPADGSRNQFGPVLAYTPVRPITNDHEGDVAAAKRVDGEQNRLFFDAIFQGEYPADLVERYRGETRDWAFVRDGDLATIHTPVDFVGVNYYNPTYVGLAHGNPIYPAPPGETTAMGWPIDPAGLYETLTHIRGEYTGQLPLYVTENGASFRDYLDPDGHCHDPERVDFLREHIRAAGRAIADGVPLQGYFVWSLLDNFEWDSGYRERFGLTYVDYPTQRRVPKDSFAWYRDVIRQNGIADPS